MGPGESGLLHICMSLNKHNRIPGELGTIQSGLDSISSKCRSSTGNDKHPTPNPHTTENEQKWAKVVEVKDEGKLVKMRTDNGDTFMMKTEGQDTTTGCPTLREAMQRTSPTLV